MTDDLHIVKFLFRRIVEAERGSWGGIKTFGGKFWKCMTKSGSLTAEFRTCITHWNVSLYGWRPCPIHQGNIRVLFVFAHHLLIAFQLLLRQQKQTNRQSNTCNDATRRNTKVLQWIILTVSAPEAILWFYNYQLCLHTMESGRRTEYSWTVWGRQWCINKLYQLV